MKKHRSSKIQNLIVVLPFLFVTFFFSLSYFLCPKQIKSEAENRYLAQMPEISIRNMSKFPKEFEKFINDHLPYRESFLKLYSRLEIASGKIKIRDLYNIDGLLLVREYLYPEDKLSQSAKSTNELFYHAMKNGKQFIYISLPYKTSVYNYMLPEYLQTNYGELNFDNFASRLDEKIKVCDAFRCYDDYSHTQKEKYFFKTDLHWNIEGASVAFQYIMDWLYQEKLITSPINNDNVYSHAYLKNTQYLGDLNRRFSYLFPTNEAVPVFKDTGNVPENKIKYYLTYNNNEYTFDRLSISDTTQKAGAATYNSIYSNNLGYIKMVNDDAIFDTEVIVIKDSMANTMVDMFPQIFKTTEFVDIRALKDVGIYQIIENSNADMVLLMYHQNNVTGEMFGF